VKVASVGRLAFTALARNRMRSLLTTLGIVIGVAAVVMMQAMGLGASAYVANAISGLGTNMLMIIPGASRAMGPVASGVPLFTPSDLDVIRRDAHDVALLSAVNSRSLRLVVGSANHATMVSGVTPEYLQIREWEMESGRALSDQDEHDAAVVCVIGATVRDTLFPGRDAIGAEMRVHDFSCRIVGVLASKGASAFGMDQDDVVLMPFATFCRRVVGSLRVGTIVASAVSPDRIDAARDEVTAILRHRRHILPGEEDDFAVRDPREMQALLTSVTDILASLLAGIAAISLLVGGIGVMNIMLVSVTERTREIGVRLAIGARSSDILSQFLFEAVALSGAGGVIGLGVGLAGAYAAALAIDIPFVIPAAAVPLALGVSLFVGVVFGVFPARKASRLRPLAALRFE
jgi:putative ABC transport system permease protein